MITPIKFLENKGFNLKYKGSIYLGKILAIKTQRENDIYKLCSKVNGKSMYLTKMAYNNILRAIDNNYSLQNDLAEYGYKGLINRLRNDYREEEKKDEIQNSI